MPSQYPRTYSSLKQEGKDDRLPNYAMFVKLPDWLPETE